MADEISDADYLKSLFYKLKSGADFYRMGPLLIEIMKNRDEVDISNADLKDSFTLVIDYRLQDGKIDEALKYTIRSFEVDGIDDNSRLEYANLLFTFIEDNEEHLVSLDYSDIVKHLRQQVKYLEVYSDNNDLISQLTSIEARIRFKKNYSSDREEGPLREFVQELTGLFYRNLPDEEAVDYATQIILESSK